MADQANVAIQVTGEPVMASLDRARIAQVLTNLVGNAIKFSPAGATVEIRATRASSALLVEVRDHGRGVPPEQLESIFERFHQVDKSDSRQKGGTGLGLAISRRIIQQHDGRIWVDSTPGEGSTFRFTIPLATASASSEQPYLASAGAQ
jgi:signal transduction histidine kinase